MHHAHFGFQDPLGRPVEAVSDFGTMVPRLASGDTVPVIYDPAAPDYAGIDSLVYGGFLGALRGIGAGVPWRGVGLLFMTA